MKALLLFVFAVPAFAQECSHLWNKNLEINPSTPKGYVGDSWAAYGLMGYKNKPDLAWHFRAKFPRARFMSIETYVTEKKRRHDFHFDFQFEPNPGSQNPFRDGVEMNTPFRDFEVDVIPSEGHSTDPNVVFISPTEEIHAIYYRIYVPSQGVTITEEDLPEVYAYNARTGEPMDCPVADASVIFDPDYPQSFINWVLPKRAFAFKANIDSIFAKLSDQGNNSAIPYYMFGLSKVRRGKVAVVRFKAPTFFDTAMGQGPFRVQGDVRYWSLCMQNLVKGKTLNCLPDFLAKVDAQGFVNVVVGRGEAVRAEAARRGFSYLEDRRGPDQHVMQFIYRDMLPDPDFAEGQMYKGDYNPEAVIYTEKQFLSR